MARAKARSMVATLVLVLGSIACSRGGDDPTAPAPRGASRTVDAQGGIVETDGIALRVPPNALTAPQTITITPLDKAAPEGITSLSSVYRFEPAGLVFNEPVGVEIAFTGSTTATLYWTAIGEERFENIGGVAEGGKLRATVRHFSLGFAGVASADASAPQDAGSTDGGATCGPCEGTQPSCCAGVCRDLARDSANCGVCGRACGSGMTCASGNCYGGGGGTCGLAGAPCTGDLGCCSPLRCASGTCG